MNTSEQTFIVTGDIAMDWSLVCTHKYTSVTSIWSADDKIRTA